MPVSWAIFYPQTTRDTIAFHIVRHILIIGFVFLAIRADPCFFTIFLAMLSILEYSRHASSRSLVTLHLCLCFGYWLAWRHTKNLPGAPKFFLVRTIARATAFFIPFMLDHYLVKKISATPVITDFAFPMVMGAFNQLLARFDPLGVAADLASFCNDYPDFTFLPLRIGGSAFMVVFVSFLVTAASRWRSTRFFPRSVLTILLKVIPTVIVLVYFARFTILFPSRVENVGGVIANSEANCSVVIDALEESARLNRIVGLGGYLQNCTDSDFDRLKTASSSFNSYVFVSDVSKIWAIEPNGRCQTLSNRETNKWRFLGTFEKPLLVNSSVGRILVLTGRQILREEYSTLFDAEIILSISGREVDELQHLPMKTAMIVSQTTGASRLHVSGVSDSIMLSGAGHVAFHEEFEPVDGIRTFSHSVKIATNWARGCRLRIRISEFLILGFGLVTVVGMCLSKDALLAISSGASQFFHFKTA
jgi:hypothetical protein